MFESGQNEEIATNFPFNSTINFVTTPENYVYIGSKQFV